MGVYDMLPKGSQLKLWDCSMTTKCVGDAVSTFGLDKYIVLLREGGYVVVERIFTDGHPLEIGKITKIVENSGRKYYSPEDFPGVTCFDKYGNRVNFYKDLIGEFQGIAGMEDPYYFRSK